MNYDEALEIMVRFKLDGRDIGELYEAITRQEDNRLTRETFVIKLAQYLKYLGITRNEGFTHKDEAYINKEDILRNISIYPRMLKKSIDTLAEKCDILEGLSTMNKEKTNLVLKQDVYVYSTGAEKIYISTQILDNFSVITRSGQVVNAAEYLLINEQPKIMISSEKLYCRLMCTRKKLGTVNFNETEFNLCLKPSERFEPRYNVKDEQLLKVYPLPKYNPESPDEFKQKIKENIEIKEKEEGKEHE